MWSLLRKFLDVDVDRSRLRGCFPKEPYHVPFPVSRDHLRHHLYSPEAPESVGITKYSEMRSVGMSSRLPEPRHDNVERPSPIFYRARHASDRSIRSPADLRVGGLSSEESSLRDPPHRHSDNFETALEGGRNSLALPPHAGTESKSLRSPPVIRNL